MLCRPWHVSNPVWPVQQPRRYVIASEITHLALAIGVWQDPFEYIDVLDRMCSLYEVQERFRITSVSFYSMVLYICSAARNPARTLPLSLMRVGRLAVVSSEFCLSSSDLTFMRFSWACLYSRAGVHSLPRWSTAGFCCVETQCLLAQTLVSPHFALDWISWCSHAVALHMGA